MSAHKVSVAGPAEIPAEFLYQFTRLAGYAERHLANRTQGDVAFGREHPDSLLRGKRAARRLGVVPEFDDQTID